MDFKRIKDLSEAYRQRTHELLTEAVGGVNYDISSFVDTCRKPTVNIVDDEDFAQCGAWVTVQVWVPKSDVRESKIPYRVYFHQPKYVTIMAADRADALVRFNGGDWDSEDIEDDVNYIDTLTPHDARRAPDENPL